MTQVLHDRKTTDEIHQQGPGYSFARHEDDQRRQIEAFDGVLLGILERGELSLRGAGFALQLAPGDVFVVPKGVALDWQPQGRVRYLGMRFAGLPGTPSHDRPLKLDLHGPLPACSPPPAEVLLGPTPQAWSQAWFEQGPLRIGVWACEAYRRRQVQPAYSELMHIIDGQLTLTEEGGQAHQVAAGETLVVPAGATNAWASDVLVRKVYCILG
jgi:uncharacterized cupin superfamily protein